MNRTVRLVFYSSLVVTLSVQCAVAWSHVDSEVTTDAVQNALQPEFIHPPPGSYTLPPISTISDHQLIDSTGQSVSLFDLTKGKIAVLSFMYTACADIGGCPLAAAVLQQIDQQLEKQPELARRVVLFSVSFDVERDMPERLAEIRQALAPRSTWHFLTAANPQDLQAVLNDFHQPVAKLWNKDGSWSGLFRHVLKVYLIDAHHQIRNIYSTGLLSAQLVVNDIETVLMEADTHAVTGKQP